jgi:hypothetical protein
MSLLLRTYVHATNAFTELTDDLPHDPTIRAGDHDRSDAADELRRRDLGQATTEYALVMLGAAAVALLVVTWATAGGGAGRIGRLFDRVIDAVLGRV